MKNLSESMINSICDDVAREINYTTTDILADAMSQAVNIGAEVKSIDFIEELRAVRAGPGFHIDTQSGRTDFSEPPFPMLPRLLKNAKVAKDGSLYKVIPMKAKTTGSSGRTAITTEAAMQNINTARQIAKEQRKDDTKTATADPIKGMDTFAAMQAINSSKQKTSRSYSSTGAVTGFRTASSKQDQTAKWVHPGTNANLSEGLREINMNLNDTIDRAILDIIRSYEDSY
jgi:hypothetical protein